MHLSNLQRQILFTSADIDRPKAAAAQTRLSQLNPQIKLVALQQRSGEALRAEVAKADVVLDCTDNMVTRRRSMPPVWPRYPLVTASAVGFGGQLMVLTPPWTQGCYRCLWPESDEPQRNCRTAGIVGPVVGMMGTCRRWRQLSCSAAWRRRATPCGCSTPAPATGAPLRYSVPGAARCAEGGMQIWFNDEPLACADNLSVSALLTQLEQQQPGVALALNQHILPRDRWKIISCRKAIGSCFSGYRWRLTCYVLQTKRLNPSFHRYRQIRRPEVMVEAIRASGSQLVTLAMKRVDLRQRNDAILARCWRRG